MDQCGLILETNDNKITWRYCQDNNNHFGRVHKLEPIEDTQKRITITDKIIKVILPKIEKPNRFYDYSSKLSDTEKTALQIKILTTINGMTYEEKVKLINSIFHYVSDIEQLDFKISEIATALLDEYERNKLSC